jgi:hypothetical protein
VSNLFMRRSTRVTEETIAKIRLSNSWQDIPEQETPFVNQQHAQLHKNGFTNIPFTFKNEDLEWWNRLKVALRGQRGDACHGGRLAFDLDFDDIPSSFLDSLFSYEVKRTICSYFSMNERTDKFRLRNCENIVVFANSAHQPLHRDHSLGPFVVLTIAISMNHKPLHTRFVAGSHVSGITEPETKPLGKCVMFDCATLHGGSASDEVEMDRLFFVIEHPHFEKSARESMVEGKDEMSQLRGKRKNKDLIFKLSNNGKTAQM